VAQIEWIKITGGEQELQEIFQNQQGDRQIDSKERSEEREI
jgi:hypothetical protein